MAASLIIRPLLRLTLTLFTSILAFVSSACVDQLSATLPCDDADTKGAIIAVLFGAAGHTSGELTAVRGCPTDQGIMLRPEDQLFTFLLGRELEDYQLAPSSFPIASDGRRLPGTPFGFDRERGTWARRAQLDPELSPILMPRFDAERCFAARRCPATDSDGFTHCEACTPDAPIPPAPPALPIFGPCPSGWTSIVADEDRPEVCEPPSLPRRVQCGPTQRQRFGASDCSDLGPPCPVGAYRSELPPGPVLYVSSEVPTGGAGTALDPMASLDDALAVASAGTIIALSKGEHAAPGLSVPPGVSVVGACAAETVVRNDFATPSFLVLSGTAEISDLHLEGELSEGIRVSGPRASASVAHVIATGMRTAFVVTSSASLTLQGVLTRDSIDQGFFAAEGARTSVHDSNFEDSGSIGVYMAQTQAEFADVVVRNGRGDAGGLAGLGVLIYQSRLVARGLLLEHNRSSGLDAAHAELDLEDLVIRSTRTSSDTEAGGRGMNVFDSKLRLHRSLLEDNDSHPERAARASPGQLIIVAGPERPVEVELDQVVIRDSPRSLKGIILAGPLRGSIRRIRVERVREIGLDLWSPPDQGNFDLELSDVVVEQLSYVGNYASGLHAVGAGAKLRASRLFLRNTVGGVALYNELEARVEDLTVISTEFGSTGFVFWEREVEGHPPAGAPRTLHLARARVRGGEHGYSQSIAGAMASVVDLEVGDLEAIGVRVERGSLQLERALVTEVGNGALVLDNASSSTVTDLRVSGPVLTDAVRVEQVSAFELSRFFVAGARSHGYIETQSPAVRVWNGVFTENQFGIGWSDEEPALYERFEAVQCYDNLGSNVVFE